MSNTKLSPPTLPTIDKTATPKVWDYISRHPQCTRREIAFGLGLTSAYIITLLKQLLESNVIAIVPKYPLTPYEYRATIPFYLASDAEVRVVRA